MKLLQCKIENFGKLSDFTFDFSKDITVICRENGWGKSTLAAFIRVMFFGFENPGKQDKLLNERKRYMPWQGGVYGGSVLFETGSRRYLMRRVFGKKEKDDEFELRDAETHLPSEDFSARIGEELFEIDGASFRRTVFLSQQDCEAGATDAIHAKLGNLVENTDDINSFQNVYDKLKDKTNKMSPTRKTGSLNKEKVRIAAMENSLREEKEIEKSILEIEALRNIQKDCLKNTEKKIQEAQNFQKSQSAALDLRVKKKEYLTLLTACREAGQTLEGHQNRFPDRHHIPTLEQVRMWQDKVEECRLCQETMLENRLTEEEWDLFQQVKESFGEEIPAEEEFNNLGEKPESRKVYKNSVAAGLLFVAALLTGGFFLYLNRPEIGAGAAGFFLIAFVVVFVCGKKQQKKENESARLYSLREQVRNYRRWVSKVKAYQVAEKKYQLLQNLLEESIRQYGFEVQNPLSEQLQEIRDRINCCNQAQENFRLLESRKEAFEKDNDMQKLTEPEDSGNENSLSETHEKIKCYLEEKEKIRKIINGYDSQIQELRQRADELAALRVELDEHREIYNEGMRKYQLLKKTMELLQKARDTLTARYMKPVQKGFEKYYRLLEGAEAAGYQFDAAANLTVEELGMPREVRFLSEGRKDLAGICTRMALVDAMYEGEKPFLVLDDPFVNLDDERKKRAVVFLREIAKEYQIVCFTCRNSEIMEN